MAIIPELARGLCTLQHLPCSLEYGTSVEKLSGSKATPGYRERHGGLTCDISGATFVPRCGAHLLDGNSARRAGSTPRSRTDRRPGRLLIHPPGPLQNPQRRRRTRSSRSKHTPGRDEHNQAAMPPDSAPGNRGSFLHPRLGSLGCSHTALLRSPGGDSLVVPHNEIDKTASIFFFYAN